MEVSIQLLLHIYVEHREGRWLALYVHIWNGGAHPNPFSHVCGVQGERCHVLYVYMWNGAGHAFFILVHVCVYTLGMSVALPRMQSKNQLNSYGHI